MIQRLCKKSIIFENEKNREQGKGRSPPKRSKEKRTLTVEYYERRKMMNVSGESIFISASTFQGKKKQDLYACKFLDEDGEDFFTLFTSEELFAEFEGVPKRTPVVLTMELIPGKTFVKLVNVEFLSK